MSEVLGKGCGWGPGVDEAKARGSAGGRGSSLSAPQTSCAPPVLWQGGGPQSFSSRRCLTACTSCTPWATPSPWPPLLSLSASSPTSSKERPKPLPCGEQELIPLSTHMSLGRGQPPKEWEQPQTQHKHQPISQSPEHPQCDQLLICSILLLDSVGTPPAPRSGFCAQTPHSPL